MMAAALYFRGDALVAGQAAAQAWGLLDTTQLLSDQDPVHVLLVGRNATPPPAVAVHRTRSVARQDIRWRDGIPVTSPARTLLDLAGTFAEDLELETALSAAFRNKLVRRTQLTDVMQRYPRAKGIATLRALLAQTESLHDTRSRYERKLLKLLRAAELPVPVTNVKVAGRTVDGLWPELKLVYEFDGWLQHREKFESDRLRDQLMLQAGHQVVRISGRQIDFAPYALIARLASIITALRLDAQAR
jgi:very-short-patch-repair endonuclease